VHKLSNKLERGLCVTHKRNNGNSICDIYVIQLAGAESLNHARAIEKSGKLGTPHLEKWLPCKSPVHEYRQKT
jgi:hypothetical protein